ncbi:SDR family NAD(P)-dependent oxidoreductase [Sphingobacterium oryzagri]|uniref:SDR family NAD(P)-dependent oxidoreductase n=1 Tax=Sphingobacterium oryzagri TaxID=3025669 RepID=A0ABY7WGG3_9SPHI|nr:SDR family NAD(P)-dependent oxidoreductase [Sphingobacterium sp. KACC 22765]WDF67602.1 SDR family NAD(P)-dependent oxidoreductase [Sphingobacterium sp. KACC 22765]
METKKVWFVTGASKGIGLALVKKLIQQGMAVAATTRQLAALEQAVGQASTDFLPLEVDLTADQAVKEAIEKSVAHFGKIDVLVNNAGYGQMGTLEELSDAEVKENFDVNVFGSLHSIRAVMPYFRAQGFGHIINIASVAGFSGNFPGWGIYCATKFAVVGFTEALAEEVKGFGVKATVVYPGYFRTAFLTQDSIKTANNPIAAYETARASEKTHIQEINGQQPNDPDKAAEAMIAISQEENPPVHLLLGEDALQLLAAKQKLLATDVESWKSLSLSTAIG